MSGVLAGLASSGLALPIATDLVLHGHADPDAIRADGTRLGQVVAEAAERFGVAIALPLMDLEIERDALVEALGPGAIGLDGRHLSGPTDPLAAASLPARLDAVQHPRWSAQREAVAWVAANTDLVPAGMCIGPFSLLSKLLSDPITPLYLAGAGTLGGDDEDVELLEWGAGVALATVLHSVRRQVDAGARVVVVAEPAANAAYISPRQLAAGSDVLERFVLEPNRQVAALVTGSGAELFWHCCGELTEPMVAAYGALRPAVLSLGSSCTLGRGEPRRVGLAGRLMTPAIHPLVSPWGRFGLYTFFIDAPEPAIVDTGVASSAAAMASALADLGRDVADVRWILHTHGHIDHIGGTAALWGLTGHRAQVAIHEADAGLLRSRREIIDKNLAIGARYAPAPTMEAEQVAQAEAAISGEIEPTVLLRGGEDLDLGGVTVRVHHLPGHTAGSVGYEVVGQGDLLVGDAVMMAGAASGFPGYDDPVDYRASLLRIRDQIHPERLYLGHPYRWADGTAPGVVVAGEDAARALETSLATAGRIAAAAARHLPHGVRESVSPYSPFDAVAEDLGFTGDPSHEPWSFFTTMHGHLTRHQEESRHD